MRYFDIAKGIAILAVIVGHVAVRLSSMDPASLMVCQLVFSFHMPLFFILSGYFIHAGRRFAWGREAKRLIVPYAVTAAAVVAIVTASYIVLLDMPPGLRIRDLALSWANAAVFGAGDIRGNALWPQDLRIGAIWFLLALFWARAIAHGALRTRVPLLVGAASFVAGILTSRAVFLPFSIQPGMCAALYVILGSLARGHRVLERELPWYGWVFVAAMWVISIAVLAPNFMGMATCWFGDKTYQVICTLVGSCCATYIIVSLSRLLDVHREGTSRLLSYLGRISLTILCVHLIEDNVVRWYGINLLLLDNIPATWLMILESLARSIADCLCARWLMRLRPIRAIMTGQRH